MSNIEKVVVLAAQQHGIFASFQLEQLNISRSSFFRVVSSPLIYKIDRGVYGLNGFAASWHSNALVHVLRSGAHALLSHESALINLGILSESYISKRGGEVIAHHATMNRNSGRRISSSLHRSIYEDKILVRNIINEIPQVPIECAIIESARHIAPKIFSSVVDSAIRNGLTDAKRIQKTLEGLRAAPGRSKSRINEIINGYLMSPQVYARMESALEARIFRIISHLTSEEIIPQYEIICSGNRYRLDFAIPQLRIAVEVDGFAYHADRHVFDSDKVRQNELVAGGWQVLRFTAAQSDDEIGAHFARTLPRWVS